jgi:aminobenzoyl-glutamate utilization protein B
MDHMVNLMREHVPQETRIHYVITRGGEAPNVVPDFAEVYYYVRHPSGVVVQEIFDRIVKASQGAALGTGTTVEHEIIGGVWSLLPNETLARVMDANLRQVGGITYDAREQAFAEEIHATFAAGALELGSQARIQPFALHANSASTDVGDVSWLVPTAGLSVATWVPGTAAHSWHSWQAVAAAGTSIGARGMLVAARTLAFTAIDVLTTPGLVTEAWAEFQSRLPQGFAWRSLAGDRPPPLDYRKD